MLKGAKGAAHWPTRYLHYWALGLLPRIEFEGGSISRFFLGKGKRRVIASSFLDPLGIQQISVRGSRFEVQFGCFRGQLGLQ